MAESERDRIRREVCASAMDMAQPHVPAKPCPECGDPMTTDGDGTFCERCQPCSTQPCPDTGA